MSNSESGAATGAVVGGSAGALIGSDSGHAGTGAVIGAASGAVVGGIVGHAQDVSASEARDQEELLKRQAKEIKRQRDEADDIRRQEYYDEQYRQFNPQPRNYEEGE